MDFDLSPATECDLSAIRDLIEAAYRPWAIEIGQEPGPLRDDYGARIARGQITVARTSGRIAGLVVLERDGADLLLDNIAVAPWAQGSGLGRKLMLWAETQARECTAITLYTHQKMARNIHIYERLGYTETHRVTELGLARVYMRKRI
ncbi:GNAT family N-acetyltransferase [Puniceibacterium sp. IMCC21224]|uniref:GNAT family N-acetyltransferase n=1 Tax=Puniceibacterium sp. IMCC21224 TaxID=1618204 RepID=UPI00064DF38B|nr:GNAT family N-acetyltransferase [Puniceibacterium sp. IMCC21224]KMK67154.1 acetyltransferase (GNAT) family protein [Puniceibacterium sp. IMCC21224]